MPTKGELTRENILKTAESLILQKGFASTSIDEIIHQTNITKGGFFYHFQGKNDLAKHLMLRYQREDEKFFTSLFDRAEELSDDPLQQMLIFLKLMSEAMANLPDVHPGCLVASFTSESQLLNDDVKQVTAECILSWRAMFEQRLHNINKQYTMRDRSAESELADMLTSIIEGGIIVSRALAKPEILVNQLLQFRNHIRLLYSPA